MTYGEEEVRPQCKDFLDNACQWTAVVPIQGKEKWHLKTTGGNQILLEFGEIADNRRAWEDVFTGRRFKSAYKVDETATATTKTTSSKPQQQAVLFNKGLYNLIYIT